jgi:hypothetical protein
MCSLSTGHLDHDVVLKMTARSAWPDVKHAVTELITEIELIRLISESHRIDSCRLQAVKEHALKTPVYRQLNDSTEASYVR